MTLKTYNWLWFPCYGRNHVRASYCSANDTDFFLNVTSAEPYNIVQKELSDLVRDLQLSKNKTELLSSRLHS